VDPPLRLRRLDHGLDLDLPMRQFWKPEISPRGFWQQFRPGQDDIVGQLVRFYPGLKAAFDDPPGCSWDLCIAARAPHPGLLDGGRCLEGGNCRVDFEPLQARVDVEGVSKNLSLDLLDVKGLAKAPGFLDFESTSENLPCGPSGVKGIAEPPGATCVGTLGCTWDLCFAARAPEPDLLDAGRSQDGGNCRVDFEPIQACVDVEVLRSISPAGADLNQCMMKATLPWCLQRSANTLANTLLQHSLCSPCPVA
jgi:hypothetical protein